MSLGLPLLWVLVAIILGEIFGTFFMAFHSVQGPRLGIPQLLQSRPQFGYFGALIPQAIGVFLYVGFNVFNTIIAGTALADRDRPRPRSPRSCSWPARRWC